MSLKINEIYNIDCLEGLKQIDDNSADLVVTSPPYNLGIDYDTWNDLMPWEDYLSWCKQWLTECYRILKDDGKICINHYLNFQDRIDKVSRFPLTDIQRIEEEIGFTPTKLCLWEDSTRKKFTAWGSWLSASSPYINTPYEGILISYKKYWKKQNEGVSTINKEMFMEGVSGIWKLGTTPPITKANFPEKLPEMCIELLTYKGDLVVDPFMGAGTTAKVCIKTDRNYIGFEISPNYTDLANYRLGKDITKLF